MTDNMSNRWIRVFLPWVSGTIGTGRLGLAIASALAESLVPDLDDAGTPRSSSTAVITAHALGNPYAG